MRHFRAEGKTATEIFSYVLPVSNKNFTIPQGWLQGLDFFPHSYRLKQKHAGPCGLFAILQAYILIAKKNIPGVSKMEALRYAVLEIMEKLRAIYAITNEFDVDKNFIDFYITEEREEAENYLAKNFEFDSKLAIIRLMLAFTFIIGPKMLNSYAFKESFITADGNTDIHFVLHVLTGTAIDTMNKKFTIGGGVLLSGIRGKILTQDVGLISCSNYNASSISDRLLVPYQYTWVVFYGGHFTSLMYDGADFFECDPFDHSFVECCKKVTYEHPLYDFLKKIKAKFV
ncbi:hypothetical protein TRFO_29151 [Tritrichomonas foetus]|uniref:Deubiquitinating enzyme MINDY-3/4 conserved domain-containing protein n=1 Tax=Tritrichomonas foetus TaxID=1144522 RepID=A0A1J4K163_9EUKA|nr:hypothetical protein TRFO_29151 [Tritrichomonas foetus]|eukprot:OHT03484.1 hypothetical protein TRFO_29151 [Tritrichomonas foetus]